MEKEFEEAVKLLKEAQEKGRQKCPLSFKALKWIWPL